MSEIDLRKAARRGHLSLIKWHHARRAKSEPRWAAVNASLCKYAAREGHLDLLKWMAGEGYFDGEVICKKAARRGHLAVLDWAFSGTLWLNQRGIRKAAALGGRVPVLEWLFAQNPAHADLCLHTITSGNLDAVRWFFENEACPFPGPALGHAIRAGDLEILGWLASREADWRGSYRRCLEDMHPYSRAAIAGHLHVMEWMWQAGVPISVEDRIDAAARATEREYHEITAWLIEHPEAVRRDGGSW